MPSKKGTFKIQCFRLSDKADARLRYLAMTTGRTMRSIVEKGIAMSHPKYDMTISFECEHLHPTGFNCDPDKDVDLQKIIEAYIALVDPTFVALPKVIAFELRNTYGIGDSQEWQYDRETCDLRRA